MLLDLKDRPVAIGDKEKKDYDYLKEHEELFKDLEWREIFLLAVGRGLYKNTMGDITKVHSGGLFRTSYLREEDEALLAVAAISIKSIQILAESEEIIKLSEKIAHKGIVELSEWVRKSPLENFEKEFQKEIVELARDFLGSELKSE